MPLCLSSVYMCSTNDPWEQLIQYASQSVVLFSHLGRPLRVFIIHGYENRVKTTTYCTKDVARIFSQLRQKFHKVWVDYKNLFFSVYWDNKNYKQDWMNFVCSFIAVYKSSRMMRNSEVWIGTCGIRKANGRSNVKITIMQNSSCRVRSKREFNVTILHFLLELSFLTIEIVSLNPTIDSGMSR